MKNIGIIGCGWLGLHLARHLSPTNKIYTTTTSIEKATKLQSMGFHSVAVQFPDTASFQSAKWKDVDILDSLIISVPFSRRVDLSLLLQRFENITSFIKGYSNQLFLLSSTGIYPKIESDIKENTFADDLLNPTILGVEKFMKLQFPQVNILRLGGLMGMDRVFSNYNIQTPHELANHVHFEDVCLIVEKMIEKKHCSKTYNVVAPMHPSKMEIINFQKKLQDHTDANRVKQGRKVLTDLLLEELEYEYKHPDPKKF